MYRTFSNRELYRILEAYSEMASSNQDPDSPKPIVAYRGDGSDMLGRDEGPRSDTHGTGMWFTSSEDIAASYGNVEKYLLRMRKPFEFDAKGAHWNEIDFEPATKGKTPTVWTPVRKYLWPEKREWVFEEMKNMVHKPRWTIEYEELPLEEARGRCDTHWDWDYYMHSIPFTSMGEDAYETLSESDKAILRKSDIYNVKDRVLAIFKSMPDGLLEHGDDKHFYWNFGYHDIKWPGATVNDLVRYARSLGRHDGVIIRNVVDGGSSAYDVLDNTEWYGDSDEDRLTQTEYVIFDDSNAEKVEY